VAFEGSVDNGLLELFVPLFDNRAGFFAETADREGRRRKGGARQGMRSDRRKKRRGKRRRNAIRLFTDPSTMIS
jgi:hypothetical protein